MDDDGLVFSFVWGERESGGGITNGNASTFAGFGCSFLGVESTVYFSTCLSVRGSAFSSKPNLTQYFLCLSHRLCGWGRFEGEVERLVTATK
jgi:hypothetical protein